MSIPFLTNDQMHKVTKDFLRIYHPKNGQFIPVKAAIKRPSTSVVETIKR